MSSAGENTAPPVWDISLEPSVYMLTAFPHWCGRLPQSVRVGMKIFYFFSNVFTLSVMRGMDI